MMFNTHPSRSLTPEICRISENSDPNISISDPRKKPRPPVKKNSGPDDLKHMRKAFELLSMPKSQQPKAEVSSSSVITSSEFFSDSRVYSSIHSTGDRLSWGTRTCDGGRIRRRRDSTDSCGKSSNTKLKCTIQHPFELKTEQRGRLHEEQFLQKVEDMHIEEERKRIPIAQGLPWTISEPEILVKPPLKERTRPINFVLHSDVRAVERAGFDHHIAERTSMAKKMKMEWARQRELEEEEKIQSLRRELIPRAQLMPYFDQPFIPKKSTRLQTFPKEPRFHLRPMKTSCSQEDGQTVSLCSRRHPPAAHGRGRDSI